MDWDDRKLFLRTITTTRRDAQRAQTNYETALRMAHRSGLSYSALAAAAGVSEAAVRLQFKRRGWS